MHESIAKALLKGHKRKVQSAIDDFKPRITSPSKSRNGFIRDASAYVRSIPGIYTLQEACFGERKGRIYSHLCLVESRDKEMPGWLVVMVFAIARNFQIDVSYTGIRVTNHVVERMLSRLNIHNPTVNFSRLIPCIYYILACSPDKDDELVLPANGGIVIAKRDALFDDQWALVSFIDADKARPEQIAEVRQRHKEVMDWSASEKGNQSMPKI